MTQKPKLTRMQKAMIFTVRLIEDLKEEGVINTNLMINKDVDLGDFEPTEEELNTCTDALLEKIKLTPLGIAEAMIEEDKENDSE